MDGADERARMDMTTVTAALSTLSGIVATGQQHHWHGYRWIWMARRVRAGMVDMDGGQMDGWNMDGHA